MANLPVGRRWRIVFLAENGMTPQAIADKLNINIKTIDLWIARYKQTGDVLPQKPSGRRPIMSNAATERAVELLQSDEYGGSKFVARQLWAEKLTPKLLSASTVRRSATRVTAEERDPLVCMRGRPVKALTADTRRKRVMFAKANLHTDWNRVMITDRCKFAFRYPGSKVQQTRWRRRSLKHEDACYKPNKPAVVNVYGASLLMVSHCCRK